jgi:hypothetical protein
MSDINHKTIPTTATGYRRKNKEAETEWVHGELVEAQLTVLKKGGIRTLIPSY